MKYITIWSPEKFSFVVIFKLGEITDILCVDENSQQRNKQWGWKTGKNAVTVFMGK